MARKQKQAVVGAVGGEVPTNGGAETIGASEPYSVEVTIRGVADLLFHRYSVESVDEKAKAAKGSKGKKTDDVESYVYRTPKGELALPAEYLRQSIILAAKFKQDPRSPRKSAMDLFKAGLIAAPELYSLGCKTWDYMDTRRVRVQSSAISRNRPAIKAGWTATFVLTVLLPEYISRELLHAAASDAGRLCGVGDFRPTYGRFQVVGFKNV